MEVIGSENHDIFVNVSWMPPYKIPNQTGKKMAWIGK